MPREPKHYETTKLGIATFFHVNERTVRTWQFIEEAAFFLDEVKDDQPTKAYDLSKLAELRYNKLRDAQSSRRVAKETGSAVTYSDKKDREQAWTLRYKRLETSGRLLSKPRVQSALRRWAMSFSGPLKEFVSYVVAMVPGAQKAAVKKQGLEAIAQCMSSVRDLAMSFDTDIEMEEVVKAPKRRTRKKAVRKRIRKRNGS